MMSVVGELPDTGTVMYTKGAPDVLLSNQHRAGGERTGAADDERRARILAKTERLAGQAARTLAVAFRDLARPNSVRSSTRRTNPTSASSPSPP